MARAKQTSQEYLDLINIHPHQIINLRGIRRHFPTFGLMCIRTFPLPNTSFSQVPADISSYIQYWQYQEWEKRSMFSLNIASTVFYFNVNKK